MELPPTGKKVRFPMTTWTRVDGSEIVEERAYYDLLSLMGQLLGVEDFLADFMSRAAAKS
jgi:predicted ester cyclase